MSKSLSAKIKAEKLTTYECFCYACCKPYLSEHPISCPKCGRDDMKIHIWKDGNLQCGYAKLEREERAAV